MNSGGADCTLWEILYHNVKVFRCCAESVAEFGLNSTEYFFVNNEIIKKSPDSRSDWGLIQD